MKTYAISLKHQTDRQNELIKYFKDVEFVDAINKDDIKRTKKLKRGEIACFQSHMKVWKIISNNDNEDWVLVLEDDAKPKKDWYSKLQEGIKEIDSTYGIVYLGCGRKTTYPNMLKRMENGKQKKIDINLIFHEEKSLGKLTELCNPTTQTHAYLIKPSTCKYLLESIKTLDLPIDLQWYLYGINFARFKKGIIIQNGMFDSLIQHRESIL